MASVCLEEALKNARYNEAVVVTAASQGCDDSNDDESKKEIILVPVIDTNNGGVSWQDAASHSQTESLDVGVLRHFRTKKWILPMLNDLYRNNLYETSIQEACSTLVKKQNEKATKGHCKDDDVLNVLDIGSGTGLLAMMSSKYLKEVTNKEVKIVSIEMASAMARIANQTIAENGLQDSIKIIEGHSCDPSVCPYDTSPKAIICTSELLETGLLGEGIIPALRDAWDRHLAEDAIVVPQRARVYAQVLQGELIHSFRGPHHDSAQTFQLSVGDDQNPLLGGNGIGIRLPFHADVIFADTSSNFLLGKCPAGETDAGNIQTLSDPQLVLEFDFTSKHFIPSPSGREVELQISATTSGVAHGILFWWELDLWEGKTYSTEVGKAPWQDHWQQCLYVFGEEHDQCQILKKGQAFTLVTHHDDTSISFRISSAQNLQSEIQPLKKLKVLQSCDLKKFGNCISCERALQLNDRCRMDVLQSSIEHAIRKKGKQSMILDLSDFSLCSVIAAKSFGAERVISLESSTSQLPTISALVAQHGNHLPNKGCEFLIINAYAEQLTCDFLGSAVDIVLAEPYYEILEGWHLQEALNYFYLLRSLKLRGVVKSDAVCVPCHAKVMLCAVQLHQSVVDSYAGLLDSKLCGFSHVEVSKYGGLFSSFDVKIPMFQYKWRRLSESVCVSNIQYDGPAEVMYIGSENGECTIEADLTEGLFHGIVIWVDYFQSIKDDNSEESVRTITTGNIHHHQAFRFAKNPTPITENGAILKVKMTFGSKTLEDHVIDMEIRAKKKEL